MKMKMLKRFFHNENLRSVKLENSSFTLKMIEEHKKIK
jgi:hypothetical protein